MRLLSGQQQCKKTSRFVPTTCSRRRDSKDSHGTCPTHLSHVLPSAAVPPALSANGAASIKQRETLSIRPAWDRGARGCGGVLIWKEVVVRPGEGTEFSGGCFGVAGPNLGGNYPRPLTQPQSSTNNIPPLRTAAIPTHTYDQHANR